MRKRAGVTSRLNAYGTAQVAVGRQPLRASRRWGRPAAGGLGSVPQPRRLNAEIRGLDALGAPFEDADGVILAADFSRVGQDAGVGGGPVGVKVGIRVEEVGRR